jgi:LuxR family transcriptional regulator, maltose regulon positive regulatory protein
MRPEPVLWPLRPAWPRPRSPRGSPRHLISYRVRAARAAAQSAKAGVGIASQRTGTAGRRWAGALPCGRATGLLAQPSPVGWRRSYAPGVVTPVLATKLFAPSRRRQLTARPRLTARLDSTLDPGHRMTLVSAPAGFGKTTAVSDWLADIAQRQPHAGVGWLSLDAADNDLTRLMTHLATALNSAGMRIEVSVVETLNSATDTALLGALVNELNRAGHERPGEVWVLILDDYHVIESADVHGAMTFLLDHLPEHLRLLITTRSDPPLPLARLRSRGQLTELRAAELRFTASEAHAFLTRTMELDLTEAEVDLLEERTEGWITGLQLSALSLRGMGDRAEVASFIAALNGSSRFVIDYLTEEVLSRQPEQVRDFLTATAELDRLTGPLCDALSGRADGAQMLEHLERSNLFVVPLDDERTWYRYHHLFADVLRARVRVGAPEQVSNAHRQASGWFAVHGMIEDAVSHSLAAEDFERAAYLVEAALPDLRRTRQDKLVLGWIRALPDKVVRRSPVLSVMAAWSLMMAGDLDAVDPRLDDAEAALVAAAHDPERTTAWADTDDLRTAPATVAVYRASLAQARGDVADTVRHAERALDLAGPADHFIRGAAGGLLGLATWAAGDVRSGLETFAEAVRNLRAAGNEVDALDSTVVLADMWMALGRPTRARLLCEQALRAATDTTQHARAPADLHIVLAELDRELDELASAEAHLETARVLAERASITENHHRWFVASAQLRASSGDPAGAAPLLAQAEALYRHGFYPDVRPIGAMRARLQIAFGDLGSASAWAEESGVRADDDPEYLREYEHLTLARLLLAQHRGECRHPDGPSSLTAVLGLLERMLAAAVHAGRDGSAQEINALLALGHHCRGDQPAALAALSRALTQAPEPDSYVRLYLDEGSSMMSLLESAATAPGDAGDGRGTALRERAQQILRHMQPLVGAQRAQSLAAGLSQRELAVLRLLDSALTGPEIARELYVTVNTFRTHNKRIFTKLDVKTRSAAVRRAHELGLL